MNEPHVIVLRPFDDLPGLVGGKFALVNSILSRFVYTTSTDYFVRPYVCICNIVCLSTGISLDHVFCYMLLFNNKCISDWFFCQVVRRIGSQ